MKILRLFLVLFLLQCTLLVNAQSFKPLLVLDNYTIQMDNKGASVGKFISPTNETITLISDASGLFEITKDGELKLKKNKLVTASSPMTFEIIVQHGNEQKAFDIVKDEFIKNSVIAHRGAWKHTGVDQNTVGALKHAIELGCQGSEFDVWMTKDRRVALNHDGDLDGRIVERTNLADLQTIKLKQGEVTATLEEYIDLIKTQNKTRLVLELKSNGRNANVLALADSCVNIVHRMKAQAWVDYISFDYRGIKTVRAIDATAHTSLLSHSVELDLQKFDGMSGIDYNTSLYDKMEHLKARCDALGLTTNVWTVNSREQLERFVNLGVDFITTDEPEMLLEIIKNKK